MKKQWVVLVSQMVRGKSKAPERGNSNWIRHKPYRYNDSWKDHEILYSMSFAATEEDAKAEAKRINDAMFDTYVMGMGKTDIFCVKEFSVSIHDCTDDITYDIDGSVHTDKSRLWEHRADSVVSNKRLIAWNVIFPRI